MRTKYIIEHAVDIDGWEEWLHFTQLIGKDNTEENARATAEKLNREAGESKKFRAVRHMEGVEVLSDTAPWDGKHVVFHKEEAKIGVTDDGKFVAYLGSLPDEGNEGYGDSIEEAVADLQENLFK